MGLYGFCFNMPAPYLEFFSSKYKNLSTYPDTDSKYVNSPGSSVACILTPY